MRTTPTTNAADLAALDAALARDALAQARAERRASSQPARQAGAGTPAARFARALVRVGEARL